MIGYLEGALLKKEDDRILLLAGQVGYEVYLPAVVMASMQSAQLGDKLALFIYYHQTDRQPKPVLIGFNLEAEKEFFQLFISVEAIGPLKAAKALVIPVREIARAIETRDVQTLEGLKGIGKRSAMKIVATLQGRVGKFALIRDKELARGDAGAAQDFTQQVFDVLLGQLGHKSAEAKQMIAAAFKRNPAIATAEQLFEEVYRGEVLNP